LSYHYIHSKKSKTSKKLQEKTDKEGKDSIPSYLAEDQRLPTKFAEQVLELEMNVEHNVFTIKQVQRLMALYSKAVEFYGGKSDGKYLHYQDKLQNLLSQPKILDILSYKSVADPDRVKVPEKVETDLKTKEQLKKKERMLKMTLHMNNKEMEKSDVKTKIIEDHATVKNQESKIIESNLSQQSDNLKRRLEERRIKMMQKQSESESVSTQLTNSSTPNQTLSSKKQNAGSGEKFESKSQSSGTNSVDENMTFEFNFDSLKDDDKFSDELMNRLKVLQVGYDDNDYDNEDLFNEGAVEAEIEKILNKCDEEVEKILEEDRQQIEDLYERIANEKFEKLAEIKAEYKYKLKITEDEEERKQLENERDDELKETIKNFDCIKEQQIQELKLKHKENKDKIKIKREGIKKVTNRVRRSASRKASNKKANSGVSPKMHKYVDDQQPNFTNIMPIKNIEELKDDISRGLVKDSGSSN
jgi:hypothetical protein